LVVFKLRFLERFTIVVITGHIETLSFLARSAQPPRMISDPAFYIRVSSRIHSSIVRGGGKRRMRMMIAPFPLCAESDAHPS
jgi:hypothetical protein